MTTNSSYVVLATPDRAGLEWLLYGHVAVPYWLVAIVVGAAVTVGMVVLLRRLDED